MCDYSLMNFPNRLAIDGEELVTYRFPTGSIGLIALAEWQPPENAPFNERKGFSQCLREVFVGRPHPICVAVCVPPGARLLMEDIPQSLQRTFAVGRMEEVTFAQISAAPNTYRDAVRFRNGQEVRLQELGPNQPVRVLDLSLAGECELVEEEDYPTSL